MAYQASKELVSRLEEMLERYRRLTEQITLPEIINNREQYLKLSKERAGIEPAAEKYIVFKKDFADYEGARAMLEESDAELRSMAMTEIRRLEPELTRIEEELQVFLLPKDPNDAKNVILEIRAGVGGDEAGIFAGDLFGMYKRYAEGEGFRVEIINIAENSSGGFKEVICLIEGEGAYSKLKYESGAHRVQRVRQTDTQGRVHPSTATVAVLPEAEEVELTIEQKDLRIDVFRSGGKGGQSVNTTDSAVRITYLPTNEVVICQDEKSQLKNKNKAMKVLRSRLLEKLQAEQHKEISDFRRSQVGSGMRNERIRTYNYPQSRCTDHRIGLTSHNLDAIMKGDITPFVQALANYYQMVALKGEGAVRVQATDDD